MNREILISELIRKGMGRSPDDLKDIEFTELNNGLYFYHGDYTVYFDGKACTMNCTGAIIKPYSLI